MGIYENKRTKINYRKIYEDHYGEIPIDEDGRRYDIHHTDGNSHNNDPTNLKAVSIQEHYDLHYAIEDWGSCIAIKSRMSITSTERRSLLEKFNKKRFKEGLHPWQKRPDGTSVSSDRVRDGKHPMVGIGKKHHSHNPTLFTFKNDDGRLHHCTCFDLRVLYPELCKKQLSKLIHGKTPSFKGWRIS